MRLYYICNAYRIIIILQEQFDVKRLFIDAYANFYRTGLLVMLCQSIAGAADEVILEDYCLSESMRKGSAAADSMQKQQRRPGKLDRTVFAGAPRHAMSATLAFMRNEYGSVCPGYLDFIGFGSGWRSRFRRCFFTHYPEKMNSYTSSKM